MDLKGKRVAVVGSGITGLGSAWILHRNGARVTLFEKEASCGGHTLTDDSPGYPVDLGFQVYNLTTYPNFVGLLDQLGVDSEPSDMSFALSIKEGELEWGSHDLSSIFAQKRNLLSLSFWRMLWDVVRFGREAPEVLEPGKQVEYSHMSMGTYLVQKRYSRTFIEAYLLPMCAAVWSVPNQQVMQFPVVMLVRFWLNHHLLDIFQRPVWRVVKGRSRSYVQAILSELPDVRTSCAVSRVVPGNEDGTRRPAVTSGSGKIEEFDAVILATHSDTSLALLGDAVPQEAARVLEAIPYSENAMYVHTDETLMPRLRKTWASWNFLASSSSRDDSPVCVTYWINRLQALPPGAPQTFVTLNPERPPAPDKTLRKLSLAHPVYSFQSYQAQAALPGIQGIGSIYYAGAWCGYGFHEDGLKAGLAVAQLLGAGIPWVPRPCHPKISLRDQTGISVFDRFARQVFCKGHLRIILPNGAELSYGKASDVAPPVAPGEEWRGRPNLAATVRVYDCSMFWKLIWRHDSGLGDSYIADDFEVDNWGGFMAILVANAGNIEGGRGGLGILNWLGSKLSYFAHLVRANTRLGSRSNIEQHYDAGNDMYRLFLDDSMTYSSGMYCPGDSLADGQVRKLDALIGKADIQAHHHVLEMGCGWGSMAIRAVQTRGCRWTGITLSKKQLEEATRRVKVAGLEDRITLLFCDYRDLPGVACYDRLLSCEMIEAVGHEFLPAYFHSISRLLKPGGLAVIQAISMPDARYEAYCNSSDFIREHIFPGGHLPSLGAMNDAALPVGLSVQGVEDIGKDYAVTLRQWRGTWEARKAEVLQLGYPAGFWRKYRMYFAYCEAAFDAGYIHNFQIVWEKRLDAPALAMPASGQVAPPDAVLSVPPAAEDTDHVMQALLALYFLLALALGHMEPKLRVVPVICLASVFLFSILYSACTALWPAFRGMGGEKRAWWCFNAVHLLYSLMAFGQSMTMVLRNPHILDLRSTPAEPAVQQADFLVSASAGFFAFHLFTLVRYRLFKRRLAAVIHLTLLLVLFTAAVYKAQQPVLLAATLLSHLPSALYCAQKLLEAPSAGKDSATLKALRVLELVCLPVFQLIPHLVITAIVLSYPPGFTSPAYWAVAVIGCLYLNGCNLRLAWKLFAAPSDTAPKTHTS